MMDTALIQTALSCKCPKCGKGDLYPSRFDLRLKDKCEVCGLALSKNDSADGPAVFLIFILGALLVPLALFTENLLAPPMWLHIVVWGGLAIFLTVGALRPLKAYIIALQFKHRPGDWE